MKAVILEGQNQPLVVKEVDRSNLEPGEACVQIHAAALNHRDLWIQKGQYAKIRYPHIPGSDGAGVVVETANSGDEHWVGKSVVLNPNQNWGPEERFQAKAYTILGMPSDGTFAEYVRIPVDRLEPSPPHLDWYQAAALPLAGLTAYRSVFTRAGIQSGEKVLITGIGGGVAQAALMLVLAAGAEVWVTSSSDSKIQQAEAAGAKGGFNYRTQPDWHKHLKEEGLFFDAIVDSAAGPGFNQLLEVAKPGGRIVFYGGTAGPITDVLPAKVFWRQLTIHGSTMGSDTEFRKMVQFIQEHQVVPAVDQVFRLDEAQKAYHHLESGNQLGKVVLDVAGDV